MHFQQVWEKKFFFAKFSVPTRLEVIFRHLPLWIGELADGAVGHKLAHRAGPLTAVHVNATAQPFQRLVSFYGVFVDVHSIREQSVRPVDCGRDKNERNGAGGGFSLTWSLGARAIHHLRPYLAVEAGLLEHLVDLGAADASALRRFALVLLAEGDGRRHHHAEHNNCRQRTQMHLCGRFKGRVVDCAVWVCGREEETERRVWHKYFIISNLRQIFEPQKSVDGAHSTVGDGWIFQGPKLRSLRGQRR